MAEEARSEEGSDDEEEYEDFELVLVPKKTSVPEDTLIGSDAQHLLSDNLEPSQSETSEGDSAKSDQSPRLLLNQQLMLLLTPRSLILCRPVPVGTREWRRNR